LQGQEKSAVVHDRNVATETNRRTMIFSERQTVS
jgi:hypothetical protein